MKTIISYIGFIMVALLLVQTNTQAADYPTMTLIKAVESSSYLVDSNRPKLAYHPINLFDEDNNTAWFEGVGGDGIHEWVEFTFLRSIDIQGIEIVNGYGKSRRLFEANNRIKTLLIIINGRRKEVVSLKDAMEKQTIGINANDVTKIRLIIKDIYKGRKYEDTGFSEISFLTQIEKDEHKAYDRELAQIFQGEDISTGFGRAFDRYMEEKGESVTPKLIRNILQLEYPLLDGAGNDVRLYEIVETLKRYPQLLPALLKMIYDRSDKGLFVSESESEDPYAATALACLNKSVVAIPLMKRSNLGYYESYYYLLEAGETRIIPQYLDKLIETGIWHEATCSLMPSEILVKQKDNYTKRMIEQYLREREMSEEVRRELEKALSGMD